MGHSPLSLNNIMHSDLRLAGFLGCLMTKLHPHYLPDAILRQKLLFQQSWHRVIDNNDKCHVPRVIGLYRTLSIQSCDSGCMTLINDPMIAEIA